MAENGFFKVTSTPPPTGWVRVRTISGKPAGLGFSCPKCHLEFRHSAPDAIFHCGKWEKAPLFTALLPEHNLGNQALPPNVVPCFWED